VREGQLRPAAGSRRPRLPGLAWRRQSRAQDKARSAKLAVRKGPFEFPIWHGKDTLRRRYVYLFTSSIDRRVRDRAELTRSIAFA